MKIEDIKLWVEEGIVKGYTLGKLEDMLKEAKVEEDVINKMRKEYRKQIKEQERSKAQIGFFQKWKIKRQIKALTKCINLQRDIMSKIKGETNKISKKEEETLEGLREQMITAICGEGGDSTKGLVGIFEIYDDEKNIITPEILREKYNLDELTDLLEELVKSLEREI